MTVNKNVKSKMSHSESEPDFFNFAINSLSNFDPTFSESKSESDESESDFSSVFINLEIYIFLAYIYTLVNKLADDFFYLFLKQSIVMLAMQGQCIFSFGISLPKKFVLLHHQILLL